MRVLPGCVVLFESGRFHADEIIAQPEYYERLRDALDKGETGWIELTLAHGAGGRTMIRLEKITSIMLATEGYCAEKDAWERTRRITDPDA